MILDDILIHKRAEVAAQKQRVSLAEMRTRAQAMPAARDFAGALVRENVALIAEIKRASPSRGELNAQVDPVRLAQTYVASGAAAISVLTDRQYFAAMPGDWAAVRRAVRVPVLRKDFIVDEYQVYESRALQADAILLIVCALSDAQLGDYLVLARSLGMSALVEVHTERELERALAAGAHVIGINNRNLADFTVNLATTERLAPRIAKDKIVVAESGMLTRADVERMARAGVRAVLVGEALMRAADVSAKARDLASVRFLTDLDKPRTSETNVSEDLQETSSR
jgi:indole-3-glycerol phosphate synthase